MGKTKIATIDDSVKQPEKAEATEALRESERAEASHEQKEQVKASAAATKKTKVSKRAKKKIAATPKYHSKKYQTSRELLEISKKYPLKEAVELAQKSSYSKFTGTIEAHVNTSAKNLRGLITLPFFAGKKLTVLAFGKGAKESGADIVGSEDTIEEINKGKINFDVLVVTPEWMPKLAKVARILGPRSLMPNPKAGTITENLEKAVTELKGGKTEYKTEKDGQVIHLSVGKTDQDIEEVGNNIKAIVNVVGKTKIKKITISPTMGVGVKIDLSSI